MSSWADGDFQDMIITTEDVPQSEVAAFLRNAVMSFESSISSTIHESSRQRHKIIAEDVSQSEAADYVSKAVLKIEPTLNITHENFSQQYHEAKTTTLIISEICIALIISVVLIRWLYFCMLKKREALWKSSASKVQSLSCKISKILSKTADSYCNNNGIYAGTGAFKSILEEARLIREIVKKQNKRVTESSDYCGDDSLLMDVQDVIVKFNEFIITVKELLEPFEYESSSMYVDLDGLILKCDVYDKMDELQGILLPITKLLDALKCLDNNHFQDIALNDLSVALHFKDVSSIVYHCSGSIYVLI